MTNAEALALVQGTPEWRQARVGFTTASRAKDAIDAKKNGEETAKRADYRTEIICERLTGLPTPDSAQHARAVQWGREHEAEARAAYELATGELVDQVGFVLHPTIERFGCSPDGLVGDDGMLQIKCPDTTTHIEWLRAGTIPLEHVPQLAAELSCNPDRDWIDFCSFDPRLPEWLQLFIVRFERRGYTGSMPNAKFIASLEAEIEHFNAEVDQVMAALPPAPQPIAKVLDFPLQDEF